jgi:hypothetical protein
MHFHSVEPTNMMVNRNRQAIHLNNTAVDQFQAGRLLEAFKTLSRAASMTGHAKLVHVNSEKRIYEYSWVDCSSSYRSGFLKETGCGFCLNEGAASFLSLRALKVSTAREQQYILDGLCPCGYAWVIWFNLGVVSNLMGIRLGEKGYSLLEQAYQLFEKVQFRIDVETPSRDWSLLQLAVLNNQACIHHELSRSESLELYLERLGDSLNDSVVKDGKHWLEFFLNYVFLRGRMFAPAA